MPDRRKFIGSLATVGTAAVAGCSREDPDFEEGGSSDSTENSGDSEEDGTDDENESEAEETSEAVFEVTNTQDGTYLTNEEAYIRATIENTGNLAGEQNIELIVDGEVVGEGEIELEAGEEYQIESGFSSGTFEPGEYEYTIATEDDEGSLILTIEDSGPDKEEIELLEHELVIDDGQTWTDVYVEGLVANNADSVVSYVEVTVRVYDSDGNQLDRYIDNTTELAPNTNWAFQVSIREDPDSFEEYDIAVGDVRY
jgi:hypothetical protein